MKGAHTKCRELGITNAVRGFGLVNDPFRICVNRGHTLKPIFRKLLLAVHVTSSVGWIGAITTFLVLAVAGLSSANDLLVRAAYLGMALTGWSVVVPLSFASLITGVVQGIGTPWGLVRHYWVLAKLLITVLATLLLLLHMQPTTRLAALAAAGTTFTPDTHELQMQLVADAVLALIVLLVAMALAIYKPQGITRYGANRKIELGVETHPRAMTRVPTWAKVLALLMIALVLTVRAFSGHAIHGVGNHVQW